MNSIHLFQLTANPVSLSLSSGQLRVHVVATGGDYLLYSDITVNDGAWYKVELGIERTALSLIGE